MNEYTKRSGVLSLAIGSGFCLLFVGVTVCLHAMRGLIAPQVSVNAATSSHALALKMVQAPHVVSSVPEGASSTLLTLVGQCATTTVAEVGQRLEDEQTGRPIPNSGSQIFYANGGLQVSYDMLKGIEDSHAGDEVKLCLVSVPTNCPPGDDRGKVYAATNLRTGESWQASDAEHECGGA